MFQIPNSLGRGFYMLFMTQCSIDIRTDQCRARLAVLGQIGPKPPIINLIYAHSILIFVTHHTIALIIDWLDIFEIFRMQF